jgi:hypothetical protein
MAGFVTINVATMGEPVKPVEIPIGSTLGEVKVLKGLNIGLEYRIKGNRIDDDYTFGEEHTGLYLVGTQDAKGGIL